MKGKINVHIADDHKILIEGIVAVINTDDDIEVEGYSLTGQEVIDWATVGGRADVLVLDITMPIKDGFQVLKFFKSRRIVQKIIVLSSYDDPKIIREVISLGAKGYVSKNSAGEHIVDAIKAVNKGNKYFSDDIRFNLLDEYTDETSNDQEIIDDLSERELAILKLIAKEFSTPEMARKLNLSSHTITSYRKNLLTKINAKNSVGLAMFALKNKII